MSLNGSSIIVMKSADIADALMSPTIKPRIVAAIIPDIDSNNVILIISRFLMPIALRHYNNNLSYLKTPSSQASSLRFPDIETTSWKKVNTKSMIEISPLIM